MSGVCLLCSYETLQMPHQRAGRVLGYSESGRTPAQNVAADSANGRFCRFPEVSADSNSPSASRKADGALALRRPASPLHRTPRASSIVCRDSLSGLLRETFAIHFAVYTHAEKSNLVAETLHIGSGEVLAKSSIRMPPPPSHPHRLLRRAFRQRELTVVVKSFSKYSQLAKKSKRAKPSFLAIRRPAP